MRRILVHIDGTELSASILPDARRLAGSDGTIILVRDAGASVFSAQTLIGFDEMQEAENGLDALAERLRNQGVNAEAHTLVLVNPADAIDTAADAYGADMVACATHGRGPMARLLHGGVAWKALAHSPVPVLLRHVSGSEPEPAEGAKRHIMVPLDGSSYSERALPLAQALAAQWNADILLVRVVVPPPAPAMPYSALPSDWEGVAGERAMACRYLSRMAGEAPNVLTLVRVGNVADYLVETVESRGITDVVMASHGRTGLSRMILGSVTDELIHRLHCPVIVVPAMVGTAMTEEQPEKDLALV
jgi:nucleotide-binding universal stress UspA family protein